MPEVEVNDGLDLGLTGKVAVITGGSEGLGRACAERFARAGAHIAICARRKDVLERTAAEILRGTGVAVLAQAADVVRADAIEAFVNATVARFGGIDILVNNAGTYGGGPGSTRWTMRPGRLTSTSNSWRRCAFVDWSCPK
jgi:3-oxoacyl-[acyl-carrier protein] reductase